MSYGFQAAVGLVGVETGDGTVLPMPEAPQDKTWLGELPLPLYGTLMDRREKVSAGVIGRIDEVTLYDHVLWAHGEFEGSELARDFAGACRLGAAHLTVDVTGTQQPLEQHHGLALRRMEDWTAVSVSAVRCPSWELPQIEFAREKETAGLPGRAAGREAG